MLCDIQTPGEISKLEQYLQQQTFSNYELIVLPEGYQSENLSKSKNLLLWAMAGNLFVFASFIDQNNTYFLKDLFNTFLTSRTLGLLVSFDESVLGDLPTNQTINKQVILGGIHNSIETKLALTESNLRIMAGYKSVIKPVRWYKEDLVTYGDLNLLYRVLDKHNIYVEGRSSKADHPAQHTNKQELQECLQRFINVENNKKLQKLSKQLLMQCKKL